MTQSTPDDGPTRGALVRHYRLLAGIRTQAALAARTGLGTDTIKKIERDVYGSMRPDTAERLAAALGVTVPVLLGIEAGTPAPAPGRQQWEAVRRAIDRQYPDAELPGHLTLNGVRVAFGEVTDLLLLAGHFSETAIVLPPLLRYADALPGVVPARQRAQAFALRSQVRQAAGRLMLHVREWEAAEQAFALALDSVHDELTVASATELRCWGLIEQGRFTEAADVASNLAGEIEPVKLKAPAPELAGWGRLQMVAAAAGIRGGRHDEAEDALRWTQVAALAVGRHDIIVPHAPWHWFGPQAARGMQIDHAVQAGRARAALGLSRRLDRDQAVKYAPRSLLDIAHAHVMVRDYDAATGVLLGLRDQRRQWFSGHRYAADIVQTMMSRRKRSTPGMIDLAGTFSLPW